MTNGLFGLQTQRSVSPLAVAEKKLQTCPWMRIRHFNIARIPWSNLIPIADGNGGFGAIIILSSNSAFGDVSMSGHVDEAVVVLRVRGGGGGGG